MHPRAANIPPPVVCHIKRRIEGEEERTAPREIVFLPFSPRPASAEGRAEGRKEERRRRKGAERGGWKKVEGGGYFQAAEEPRRELWSGGYRVAERRGTLLLRHREEEEKERLESVPVEL